MPDIFVSRALETPTILTQRLLDAVRPVRDPDASINTFRRPFVEALVPLIGHYTVADAMQLLTAVRSDTLWRPPLNLQDNESADFGALCSIGLVLEDFVCAGHASTDACTQARALLLYHSVHCGDAWDLSPPCLAAISESILEDARYPHHCWAETFRPSENSRNWLTRIEEAEAAQKDN